MNRKSALFVFLVAVVLSISASVGDDDEPKDPAQRHSFWMKKKLGWSQSILAGLANADWNKIGQDARSMRILSKVEGRFRRAEQAEYRAQLAVFDQANNELIHAIDEENIDAATLAYMHLIHSCVNCHKTLRKEMANPK